MNICEFCLVYLTLMSMSIAGYHERRVSKENRKLVTEIVYKAIQDLNNVLNYFD